MRKIKNIVYLSLLSSIAIFNIVLALEKKIYLKDLHPSQEIFRGIEAQEVLKIPKPDRWKIKGAKLHIEIEKSLSLVEQRSNINIFFNKNLIFQKKFNPKVNKIIADVNIPSYFFSEEYNDLKIRAIHHYCLNCCEYEGSPELWSKVNWERSYITIKYEERPFKENLIFIRNYILDQKRYDPIKIGIIIENNSNEYIKLGGKVSGYLGSSLKYRKVDIKYLNDITKDRDIFIIGTRKFVNEFLDLKQEIYKNVFVLKNPLDSSKGIIVITGNSAKEIDNVINAFISIKEPLVIGKDLNIDKLKMPQIEKYQTPKFIETGKNVYFAELGYQDFNFYGMYPPPLNIQFKIYPDLFLKGKEKVIVHLAYNYGKEVRKDSTINIFLNGEYLTSLKIEKEYGTILEEKEIKIPVYMLSPGLNTISIQYALMPKNEGFCVAPNINALQGTVFSRKSYIYVPKLPHWTQMPYLEYFITDAFPFMVYPDLKGTQIFITDKSPQTITALYTLLGYIGEKTRVPPYNLDIISNKNHINPKKDIIVIGSFVPQEFYKNLPIKIYKDKVLVKYPLLRALEGKIYKKLFQFEEDELKALLSAKNRITNEVFFLMGQSPYKDGKTLLVITSNNKSLLAKSIYNLYTPRFAGQIKGDVAIVDFSKELKVYNASIGDKYYVGHLPFIKYILYKFGYSLWYMLFFAVIAILLIVFFLIKYLDRREKKRLRGEI